MSQEFFTKNSLTELAANIRESGKSVTLLFAYNGAGKTRLSMEFKEQGKATGEADTLYFNAFTQDLFWWNNDLAEDRERFLNLNVQSRFFGGLQKKDIENKIRPLLHRYATFNFDINWDEGKVIFFREEVVDGKTQVIDYIKVSRGEENLFYWCFYLAIAQLAIDGDEDYTWVNYLYVDDPISSLDDNNAIALAHHLAMLLKSEDNIVEQEDPNSKKIDYKVKGIISTHHALLFNVLCNEFGNRGRKLYLRKKNNEFEVKSTGDSPFIYHIAMIQELNKIIVADSLFTYHFSTLRTILEKAASFHGFNGFTDCIIINDDDEDGLLKTRIISALNHSGYSLFEPTPMGEDNKKYFKQIFENYLKNYKFNTELFEELGTPLIPAIIQQDVATIKDKL